jgi:carbon monoxide dehydrogenase subunit G
MDIAGSIEITAPPESVWAALNDPVVLAQCVSGCDSFEQTAPHNYAAIATVKIGPVRSRITVNITFTESHPPHHAILAIRAKGAVGSADTHVSLHLDANVGGTTLNYNAQANLEGQLRRFAKHWGRDAAQELVEEFFRRFAAAVPPEPIAPQTAPAFAPIKSPAVTTPPVHRETPMRKKALWIGIGAAAGAAVTTMAALLLTRRGPR